ncbi:MAG: class II aldolase/adducin family protein [Desulfatiglandaceae bacterium]
MEFIKRRFFFKNNLCGEARYFLGEIVTAPYKLMGTHELAESVAQNIKNSKAVLFKNHGALTVGESLFKAYDRMEVLENLAELQILLNDIGAPRFLGDKELSDIDNL